MHTLHLYCAATSGYIGLPAYIQTEIIDDKVVSHYNSTTQRKVPAQCMKSHLEPQFWNWTIEDTQKKQDFLLKYLAWIKEQRHQTGEWVFPYIHILAYIHPVVTGKEVGII